VNPGGSLADLASAVRTSG